MVVTSTVRGAGRIPQQPGRSVLAASPTALHRRWLDTGDTTTRKKIVMFELRHAPPTTFCPTSTAMPAA